MKKKLIKLYIVIFLFFSIISNMYVIYKIFDFLNFPSELGMLAPFIFMILLFNYYLINTYTEDSKKNNEKYGMEKRRSLH